ncbi:hypothetical protein CY34DRAFT_26824 [Suillus luteus UH-Slu-Lm8-n1]|uniref:Helitron helicase-like domain-containing protein n=1 Tax=Suillus luteus UH-Slu-Lm8-n1 TaxID=930992 RepID=A0A0D0A8X1_9AGAM|nr:hypothetical protein CY34DRAFT_26824 [Suillus luteus UH-Slu-Lm8-n1]
MIEGQFLPQPVTSLALVLAVTYIGTRNLPKDWLKSTFHSHNPLYADIQISEAQLARLPEDDVPQEIISVVCHKANDDIATQESKGYVPADDEIRNVDAQTIPLKFLGVTDTELSTLPLNDLMKHALMNLDDGVTDNEGGYAVCHSHRPVSDFGRNQAGGEDLRRMNPLAATYPKLFSFGVGGIEDTCKKLVGFDEHVRWTLQYHDWRFRTHHSFPFVVFGMEQKRKALQSARIQMRCKDFECDGYIINSITVSDLKQAEKEEAEHRKISNPWMCQYCGFRWGTSLCLRGPSLWITINPSDTHNPVVQVFAREQINMDIFFHDAGPDSNRRAQNIARDPFATTKYFFIIKAVLSTLFQIEVKGNRVHSGMGMLGHVSGYFGIVEAQGRGTLHVHMMIWLRHTPNMHDMHAQLQNEEFRTKIKEYIQQNIRAHVEGLDEETIQTMPKESELPYS